VWCVWCDQGFDNLVGPGQLRGCCVMGEKNISTDMGIIYPAEMFKSGNMPSVNVCCHLLPMHFWVFKLCMFNKYDVRREITHSHIFGCG